MEKEQFERFLNKNVEVDFCQGEKTEDNFGSVEGELIQIDNDSIIITNKTLWQRIYFYELERILLKEKMND